MDYSKMKSSIDRAILKSPLDVAAYDDKFALCRDYEGTEFRLAHEWNQALQEEIRAGLKLAVDTRDFKTAEEFDNLLFRSLLFCAPHYFDAYLQAVEYGKPLDKKFYLPRRHYLTTGGYTGSAMYKSNLAQAKTTIKAAFGSAHVLTKRELLTNAVNGNTPSGWAWFDSDVELMNEVQVYGSVAWGAHDGNGYNVASGDGQFPLFMFDRTKLHNREDYWLRDVASATTFSNVSSYGHASTYDASYSCGVRPAFCIG